MFYCFFCNHYRSASKSNTKRRSLIYIRLLVSNYKRNIHGIMVKLHEKFDYIFYTNFSGKNVLATQNPKK